MPPLSDRTSDSGSGPERAIADRTSGVRSREDAGAGGIGVLRRTIGRLTREKATAPMQLGKCCLVWPKLSGYHVCNKRKNGC